MSSTASRPSAVVPDNRAAFMRLWTGSATLPRVAKLYGLTAEEMGLALHYARLSKLISGERALSITPPPAPVPVIGKVFCRQCDLLVHHATAESCTSPWCKAKEALAA